MWNTINSDSPFVCGGTLGIVSGASHRRHFEGKMNIGKYLTG
jgi:hypothetical protein